MMEPRLCSAPRIGDHARGDTPTFAFKSNLMGHCVQAHFTKAKSRLFDTRIRAGVSMTGQMAHACIVEREGNVPMMTSTQSRRPANDPRDTLCYAIGSSSK
jgi:hypothetical protein